jgi:hypothetical protein
MLRDIARALALISLVAILGVRGAAAAEPAPAVPPSGSATLPLPEILSLYRGVDRAALPAADPPPVAASLQSMELKATVVGDALEIEASLQVRVLQDDAWTRVRLLDVGGDTQITALPSLSDATLVRENGALHLLTRRAGRYGFELSLLQGAQGPGARRSARIGVAPAALSELRVSFDPALFRLLGTPARQDARGALLFPNDGAFQVAWERIGPVRAVREPEAPRFVEPVIPWVRASSVATLEGQRITRVLYELRFGEPQTLALTLPPGETVQRVYLNARSVPFTVEQDALRVEVSTARAGENRAALEVVLASDDARFLLSGALHLVLPAASWPTSELHLALHLPQVFDYTWSGGSLSPVESAPPMEFTYEVPQPGKRLIFHQYLIARSRPDVTLEYSVDLDDPRLAGKAQP